MYNSDESSGKRDSFKIFCVTKSGLIRQQTCGQQNKEDTVLQDDFMIWVDGMAMYHYHVFLLSAGKTVYELFITKLHPKINL